MFRRREQLMMRSICRRHGYTLTEIAIVLAISGVVFGGIWTAANSAWQGYRASSTIRQIGVILGNVRDRYAAISSWGAIGLAGDITKAVNQENILPSDMRQNPVKNDGPLDHAMSRGSSSGSFFIYTAQTSGGAPAVQLRFAQLTRKYCINFLTLLPLDDLGIGMVQVSASPSGKTGKVVDADNNWDISVPITPSEASTWCSDASDNEVYLDFRLH